MDPKNIANASPDTRWGQQHERPDHATTAETGAERSDIARPDNALAGAWRSHGACALGRPDVDRVLHEGLIVCAFCCLLGPGAGRCYANPNADMGIAKLHLEPPEASHSTSIIVSTPSCPKIR